MESNRIKTLEILIGGLPLPKNLKEAMGIIKQGNREGKGRYGPLRKDTKGVRIRTLTQPFLRGVPVMELAVQFNDVTKRLFFLF